MVETLGKDAPSYATIKRWMAQFKHGRDSLQDDSHSGRPSNCHAIKEGSKMINLDWLFTKYAVYCILIVLGFNDTSTLEGHFVSSPREREKRDRRESRGDEREGQGRKRNRNESEETEEIKTFPLHPYPLQG